MAATLAPRKAPRPSGLVRMNAAVPRSFSPATLPIVTRMAMKTPNWPRFLVSWVTASRATGSGITPWKSAPPAACRISRM